MNDTTEMDAERLVTPREVKSGVLWITAISLFRDSLQFGLTLILVRLLSPKTYGEFSLANAFVSLFTVVSIRAFLEHTLQIRPKEPVDYQNHFTWGALTQAVAALGMLAVSLVLHHFPNYAAVSTPVAVMSLFFVLDWPSELRVKMLERRLDWTRLRLLEAIGILVGASIALLLAFRGAGVYALLIPLLIAPLPYAFDLFAVARWRPVWSFHSRDFRPSWRYGLPRIASGVVARGQQILESTVLVGLVGLSAFGIYGRAIGLASFSCLKLTSLLTLTIFPVLTRFEPESPQFHRASVLVLRAVAWSSIPVAASLSLFAGQVVHILYGPKWAGVVPLLPWALAICSITALTEAAAFLLLANLQPKKTLAIDLITLFGTMLSLLFLLPRGIVLYMSGIILTQGLATTAALCWSYRSRALGARGILSALFPPLVIAGSLTALFAPFFRDARTPATSAVCGVGWTVAYLLALRIFFANDLLELVEWMPAGDLIRRAFRLEKKTY